MKKTSKLILILLAIFSYANVYAIDSKICEYSQEFKEWTKLSDEEKEETIVVPNICESTKKTSITNNITSNASINTKGTYPTSYNLASLGQVSYIKNQQSTGTCWAFTANEMVESNLLKKQNKQMDFSERHMEYFNTRSFTDGTNQFGLNRTVDSGGNFFMSTQYFKNNYGPILESDMPFENNTNKISINNIKNKRQAADVNSTFFLINDSSCTESAKNAIKNHLMNYGAVGTTIYMNQSAQYYNSSTAAYYYDGANSVNHSVTIVGWDDNYAVSNFSSSKRPSSPGAWIIKNSYGTSFGKSGYFYVSYNDVKVCRSLAGVLDVDFDYPDNYYTYDKYGYNSYINTSGSPTSGYMASKFTKSSNREYLKEITVGAYNYAEIDLYVVATSTTLSINNATYVGKVTIPYGGYSTLKLANPIELPNTTFAIIAKYTHLAGSGMAISMQYDETPWSIVSASKGQSYVSINGTSFTDLIDSLSGIQAVASISAGTDNANVNLSADTSQKTIYNNKTSNASITVTTQGIDNNQVLNVNIMNSNSQDASGYFNVTGKSVTSNKANLSISAKTTAAVGKYTIKISYSNKTIQIPLDVKKFNFITSISANDITVELNTEADIVATVSPSNAENKNLSYTSSNTSIFTVSGTKVKAVKVGSAKLTIASNDGSNISKQINVNVVDLFKTTSTYKINYGYIYNVKPSTTYNNFVSNINVLSGEKVTVKNSNNTTVSSGNIGTGYKLVKEVNGSTSTYTIVVLGDVNGDGIINSADLLKIRQHLLKSLNLSGPNFTSADINQDTIINSADLLRERQHLLGTKLIG